MTHISTPTERIAVFPGSFNPFTVGHADIVARGLELFDHIVIAVGINPSKPGNHSDAVGAISKIYAGNPRVSVRTYEGLTVDFARAVGARFILRGVRSVKDFEYERDMAQINSQLSGIESVLLLSRSELSAISSSIVRELERFGHDVSNFLPSNNSDKQE